jgi:hypothetical protein
VHLVERILVFSFPPLLSSMRKGTVERVWILLLKVAKIKSLMSECDCALQRRSLSSFLQFMIKEEVYHKVSAIYILKSFFAVCV